MTGMSKADVIRITDAIGSDAIEKRFEVTHHAVRAARTAGKFPAAWYIGIREMCEAGGVSCPEAAFKWRAPTASAGAERD